MAESSSAERPGFSPVIALVAIASQWESELAAALRDLGISTRKFGLLGHIGVESGISFSELARRSHITVQSAHTAVRALVDDGLVADATAQAGAASDLSVTLRGAEVLTEARARLAALDAQLAQRLPDVADALQGIRAGAL